MRSGRRPRNSSRATSFPRQHSPILIGMADRNEDDLNALNRKGLPDLMQAALVGTNQG
jgi:hypothetical protein